MRESSNGKKTRVPDGPPKKSEPRREVVRLKGGQQLECVVISPKFWGKVIHWDNTIKRSSPCYGDPEKCEGCKDHLPEKTLWYLCVWSHKYGKCFVEFTATAADQLMTLFEGNASFRGLRFRVSRTRADNGRLKVDLWEGLNDARSIPPDEDPEYVLQKMWAAKRA